MAGFRHAPPSFARRPARPGCLPHAARAEADPIHLSHRRGVLYLPLIVMREAKLLEAELEEAGARSSVNWLVMDGGGQINDAMLAGALDIAGTSIPGFLTLWSKGRGTRSEVIGVSGLSTCALILNTNLPNIKSLADFKPDDKIAVPSVKSSLQAVVLQMAAAKQFGDAQWARMDPNTVTMQAPARGRRADRRQDRDRRPLREPALHPR